MVRKLFIRCTTLYASTRSCMNINQWPLSFFTQSLARFFFIIIIIITLIITFIITIITVIIITITITRSTRSALLMLSSASQYHSRTTRFFRPSRQCFSCTPALFSMKQLLRGFDNNTYLSSEMEKLIDSVAVTNTTLWRS